MAMHGDVYGKVITKVRKKSNGKRVIETGEGITSGGNGGMISGRGREIGVEGKRESSIRMKIVRNG